MNLIKSLIFLYSRKIPSKFRIFLMNAYYKFINFNDETFKTVSIEISRNCNRKCSYCPISKCGILDTSEMSFDLFKIIIDQLSDINYKGSIYFSGYNEPLLHSKFILFVKYLRKKLKKSSVLVYTNGDYLNKNLLKILKNNFITLLVTSHDLTDSNKYNELKKHSLKYKNLKLRRNIRYDNLSSRGGLVNPIKIEKKKRCFISSLELSIDYKGNVILCCDDFFSENIFGNVINEDLVEIWNKSEFSKIRANLRKGIASKKICKKCLSY